MLSENEIKTDVLVIGGGMSGLFAAIKAREEGADVTLVEKGYVGKSGSVFFAEGFYSIFNPKWGHNLKDWVAQISKTGEYMNNPEWTEVTLKDSYERYQDFLSWGIKFREGEGGKLAKFTRGVLEARYLGLGWTYLPVMRAQVLKSGVNLMDRIMVTDLIKQDGRVVGAVGFHTRSGEFYVFKAKATVICTGGGSFGAFGFYDGETMAYRAGAEISGKEFALTGTGYYSYAGSGYWGEKGDDAKVSYTDKEVKPAPGGGFGWDGGGRHYVDKYVDSEGNKLNRYTVTQAMHNGRGPILWALSGATPEEISDTLQEVKESGAGFKLERAGLDLTKGGLFAGAGRFEGYIGHTIYGGGAGIWSTNTNGGTTLPGLYAAGDSYNSRAVGARYPWWGTGLRNASVTGARAGRGAAEYASKVEKIMINKGELDRLKRSVYAPIERSGGFDRGWVTLQLQNIMLPYYIWMLRHGDRLKAALTLVEFLKGQIAPKVLVKDAHELRLVHETNNRILSAEMMLRAAIFRTESRASHYREDYPLRDDPNWLAAVRIKKKDGEMELIKEPFPKKWWPDLSVPYKDRYPMKHPGEE